MRSRLGLAIAAGCVVLLPVAGCSSSAAKSQPQQPAGTSKPGNGSASASAADTFDLAATLTIEGPYSTGVDAMTTGAPCLGISNAGVDYEDIGPGAPVAVLDNAGATAGVGTLDAGEMTTVDLASRECVFKISVTGVMGGKGFYSLRIGDHTTAPMKEAEFRAGPAFTLSGS